MTKNLEPINIPKRLRNGIDRDFLEKVKSVAVKCFENPRYQEVYRLHNKWYNHVNNILRYIADFCTKAELSLNGHSLTIIIAAAILHDVGKSLDLLHPAIKAGKYKDDDNILSNLEKSHSVISFIFIQQLIVFIKENPFQNADERMKEIYLSLNFYELFKVTSDEKEKIWMKYLQCTAWISLCHKTLNDKLLHTFKPDLKEYLRKDSNQDNNEDYEINALNFFGKKIKDNKEIKEIEEFLTVKKENDYINRFHVLSALLQLGDKLDISQKRIRLSQFYLEVFLDDITDRDVLRDKLLPAKSMILWYRFYYTGNPTIEVIIEVNSKTNKQKKTGVKITIPYFYPESIRNDFLYFRYNSEKDFEDLRILSTLEEALQSKNNNEDYRIILERTENKKLKKTERKKDDLPVRIIGLENPNERLIYCLRKICADCLKTSENELTFDKLIEGINKVLEKKIDKFSCSTDAKKCPLVQKVIDIFNNDIQRPSHFDWEKYSFKLPKNIRRLVCWKNKISTDKNKIQEYLGELENKRVMLSLSRQAKEGMKQWKVDVTEERKKLPAGTLFYPSLNSPQFTSNYNIRLIPASLDIAFILNLFRHLKEESLTIDDIANISGLDRGRIQKYCGWLEHESFLLLDDKAETYKINFDPAKYSIVEKVLKEFDTRRSEMVSKIRDIDRFGNPLALYSELNDCRIKTNIKGFDQIISPFEEKLQGLPLRKSILLVGPPGSGKTTLALDIVRQVRLQRLPEEVALYLTFAGDIQRLADDYASLGWTYQDIAACVRSLSTLQSKTYFNDPDKFFKHLLNILDEFLPDLVAIDNLGYFLRLVPTELSREIFNRLIKVLTVRGITSILIGDDIANGIGFELFDTDGVIYLHYKDGKREIEITKMRGREFAGSKHPFKIEKFNK